MPFYYWREVLLLIQNSGRTGNNGITVGYSVGCICFAFSLQTVARTQTLALEQTVGDELGGGVLVHFCPERQWCTATATNAPLSNGDSMTMVEMLNIIIVIIG